MLDLIIIGSGPAGLSAAVYGKRAGLDLMVMEMAPMSGGQVLNTYEVDNYLGMPGINGFDMGMQFREHADKLGVEFVDAEVTSVEVIDAVQTAAAAEAVAAEVEASEDSKNRYIKLHTTGGIFDARTVILAMGAGHAHLGVAGEEEFSGRGVSYCATCDGAFYKGKTVAVVGGGDVALEDAIYLSRFCEKVYLIHRRDEFRGARILQEELLSKENVEILYSHTVKEIIGDDQVTGVLLKDVKTDEERQLPLDGVFIAIGIIPNTKLAENLVECDKGYVIAGEDCVTNTPGIFVAGDARKKPLRQIITAVADGANAVTSISAYLAFQGK